MISRNVPTGSPKVSCTVSSDDHERAVPSERVGEPSLEPGDRGVRRGESGEDGERGGGEPGERGRWMRSVMPAMLPALCSAPVVLGRGVVKPGAAASSEEASTASPSAVDMMPTRAR